MRPLLLFVLAASFASGCGRPASEPVSKVKDESLHAPKKKIDCGSFEFARDWNKHPALIERDAPGSLYVIGDVHGDYDHIVKLLKDAKLIRAGSNEIGFRGKPYVWTGGGATLVQLGDLINKGSESLKVMDLFIDLIPQAQAAGGNIVVVAGNHEMAFLADPADKKLEPLQSEVEDADLDICQDVYSPDSAYGKFLRERPAAVIIGDIYMSHSGFAMDSEVDEISSKFREAVDDDVFQTEYTCGRDAVAEAGGFFNADVWWGEDGDAFKKQLTNLGVQQILFGHDPGAFKASGVTVGYFGSAQQSLIKLDVGMWKGDSHGAVYRCSRWNSGGGCAAPERLQVPANFMGSEPVFEALPIYTGPPPYQPDHEPRKGC